MSWQAKRFWSDVTVRGAEGAFTVTLDNRAIKTPAKAPLCLPTRALAEEVATEWRAVDDVIRPDEMPVTRAANSALDKVGLQRDAVIDLLASYGETDLLCHRAAEPEALAEEQEARWGPMLGWARDTLNAPLVATTGIMPVQQPAPSVAALRAAIKAHDNFELTALHDLIALTGSAVLGLAASYGAFPDADLWALSRLDEMWQERHWGEDLEARQLAESKEAAFHAASKFLRLARSS